MVEQAVSTSFASVGIPVEKKAHCRFCVSRPTARKSGWIGFAVGVAISLIFILAAL
ncbi:MAG: hypothetical protein KGZ74_04995 [Chitinophagaceae bacterium]|nr:hypothetical protein [Chitinophagaceae bacterium]